MGELILFRESSIGPTFNEAVELLNKNPGVTVKQLNEAEEIIAIDAPEIPMGASEAYTQLQESLPGWEIQAGRDEYCIRF